MADKPIKPRPPKKAKFVRIVERLIKDTRDVYRASGREESEDIIRSKVIDAIDEVWPHYLTSELAKMCGVHVKDEEPTEAEDDE